MEQQTDLEMEKLEHGIQVLKSIAIRKAMVEVIAENQAEIVKRAAAKLKADGIDVKEEELG